MNFQNFDPLAYLLNTDLPNANVKNLFSIWEIWKQIP